MRIAVIGANGRSGSVFVQAALATGHRVNAGIHGTNPFEPTEGLTVIPCDATDIHEVAKLIDGCDAVVSLIGHVKGSKANVQSTAIETVIEAMKTAGIKRLISLTGTGVRVKGDKPSVMDVAANKIIAIIDPNRIKDGIHHAELIKASPLNWTILRVLKLGNGEGGMFTLTPYGPAKLLTSRREVARAILQLLKDGSFLKGYPIISP